MKVDRATVLARAGKGIVPERVLQLELVLHGDEDRAQAAEVLAALGAGRDVTLVLGVGRAAVCDPQDHKTRHEAEACPICRKRAAGKAKVRK